MMLQKISPIDKTRIILQNHMCYDTVDSLRQVFESIGIDPKDFDVTKQKYGWNTNPWWDNRIFLMCLQSCGINMAGKEINIRLSKDEYQKKLFD